MRGEVFSSGHFQDLSVVQAAVLAHRSMEAELADTLAPHYAIERRSAFDRSQTQVPRRRRGF